VETKQCAPEPPMGQRRSQKMTKIRAEVNEIETKKTREKNQ